MTLQASRARAAKGPLCPYDAHMEFTCRPEDIERGHARLHAVVDARLHNPVGVLHGGVLSGLADTAMGACMISTLAEGESCTNIDITCRFLRPTTATTLHAEARVVKEGRTTNYLECRVTDEEDRLVAVASSTFLRLPSAGRDSST